VGNDPTDGCTPVGGVTAGESELGGGCDRAHANNVSKVGWMKREGDFTTRRK
jgi:hypothetical protein